MLWGGQYTCAVPEIKIIRSAKRKKTAQARLRGDVLEVRVPAFVSEREAHTIAKEMLAKTMARTATVVDLQEKAEKLNGEYLEGRASWTDIRWVTNQNTRWGSCTPGRGTIRISHRLQRVPQYVLDAVIIHELVHTFITNHSAEFFRWADRAPQAERAKGYLEAYSRWGNTEANEV